MLNCLQGSGFSAINPLKSSFYCFFLHIIFLQTIVHQMTLYSMDHISIIFLFIYIFVRFGSVFQKFGLFGPDEI